MSKLYNRRFKVGAGITCGVFLVLNVASYILESQRRDGSEAIKFSSYRFNWGFPYPWFYDASGLGPLINLGLLALLGFAIGFAFRYLFTRRES